MAVCVLAVEQVCPYLLICFSRCTCHYYLVLPFLFFSFTERVFSPLKVTFSGALGEHRWRGWPLTASTTFPATSLCAAPICQALLEEMKKLPFVNQLLLWSNDS